MTELSPAAQAVMDAWWNDSKDNRSGIAAALRAVVNQIEVIPLYRNPVDAAVHHTQMKIQKQLISIADELDGTNE
jgi:hypothetical protein